MKLIMLCGPAGSGKTTYRRQMIQAHNGIATVISGDEQGKQHREIFAEAIKDKHPTIIIDRMSFNVEQRSRFLKPAIEAGYTTEIVVFHVPRSVCFDRCMARANHGTINDIVEPVNPNTTSGVYLDMSGKEKARKANSALDTFFTKYEKVEDTEADVVTRLGHEGCKPTAIICDLDGTLADLTHRLHYVKNENKKHNRWDLFNKEVGKDSLHHWCAELVCSIKDTGYHVVYCSGRGDSARADTETWLENNKVDVHTDLFMRHRNDYRQDYIIKEVILDFEILPRYSVLFAVDDRLQVTQMWRRRGIVCLQCAPGDF